MEHGGLLIIFAEKIDNNNIITSNGSRGGGTAAGKITGGGSINIFYKYKGNVGTRTCTGGSKGIGGKGGDGTITCGSILTGTFVKDE